jgi:amino acid adenylation domain-containing protein
MMTTELIHKNVESIAERYPHHIAVEDSQGSYPYSQLMNGAEELSSKLALLPVKKEDIVYVAVPPSEKLIRSILAVLKRGAIYLPIDLSFGRKRMIELFRDNGRKCIITDHTNTSSVLAILKELNVEIENLIELEDDGTINIYRYRSGTYEHFFIPRKSDEARDVSIQPTDGNYLFYTSGSTGEGKAFLGCHKGLTHFINWELQEFNITADDKVSMLSQHTFDASLRDIFVPLCSGGTLCIPDRDIKTNIRKLILWLGKSGVSLIHCVPSLFRLIIKEMASMSYVDNLPKLRYILMAGEPLYSKDIMQWETIMGKRVELVNLYGTSETTLAKTFHRIKEIPTDPTHLLHCGKPIEGAFVGIVNSNRLCRIGEIGEIFIKTPYMTKGYIYDPKLQQEVFIQNPLVQDKVDIVHKTGDMGRYLHDRSIEVLGRLDNQVKINGIRVELNEIDEAVMSMPGIEQVISTVHKNPEGENELVCYYVGADSSVEALSKHLKSHLNDGLRPSHLIKLESFPLTLNGKIDRKALPRPDNFINNSLSYSPPTTETERIMEGIWMDILHLKRVSVIADFFRIGGSSIKAMQMASRIFQSFNVTIKISEILTSPTIRHLSKVIDSLSKQDHDAISPIPPQDHYELSHAQKQIWMACQLSPDNSSYNMTDALVLHGNLDSNALDSAFESMIRRHEILRTTFKILQEEPRQVVNSFEESKFFIAYEDFAQLADGEALARQKAEEEFTIPFDLQNGPLIRVKVIRLTNTKSVFLFSVHHIISDGWSLEIFFEELITLYEAFRDGKNNPLQPLKIQYKDFAHWHNTQLRNTERVREMKNFWTQQFNGLASPGRLPYDQPIEVKTSFNGDKLSHTLTEELSNKIDDFCKENKVTAFMTFLSCYYAVLYHYIGSPDIVVACPTSNRQHSDLENQIGIYLNTLPFRISVSPDETFSDLLNKVKDLTLKGFDNKHYPFDQLVGEINLPRINQRSPLTNIMFDMLDFAATKPHAITVNGIDVKPFFTVHHTNKADLTLYVNRSDHSFTVHFGYSTANFRREKIGKILKHFVQILDDAIERPSSKLSSFELHSEPWFESFKEFKKPEIVE